MKRFLVALTALLLTAALTGCGQSPAAPKRLIKPRAAAPIAAKAAPQQPIPGVSHQQGAKAPALPKPTPTPAAAPAAPAASAPGALRLVLSLAGSAPVASLSLKLFPAGEPDAGRQFPLSVAGGRASWGQESLAAGRYVLHVQAYDAAGRALGEGSTEAVVKSGAATEVSLELQVRTLAANATSGAIAFDVTIE